MRAKEFLEDRQATKLVIFDIDDTLVNTDTRVDVVRDGQVVKSLDSHQFTHYKLEPGEQFDFGRFRDAKEFFANARPIPPMIDQLKQDIATGNKVIMVTARADFNDRDLFLDTFRKFGIDMDRVHVYRSGNLNIRAATEEKKRIMIRHLLGREHYDKVIMYDDATPNLDAFLSLAQEFPWSRFYAWHVDRKGQATEYHRSGMSEDSTVFERRRRRRKASAFGGYFFPGYGYYATSGDSGEGGGGDGGGESVGENFADGKKPGRKGLAKRMGVPTKASVSRLRQIAKSSSGEKARMAHWMANMKSGKKKK